LKEYQDLMAPDKYLRYFLYSPPNDRDDYYNPSRSYSEFRFESGKSFDNVFFPQKEDLMKRLDFFKDSKVWYKNRGIPYTMGLMLYGVPGCGKTSTIKAIANYTQRHIVSVPLNRIKTCKELLSIFYEEQINHMNIPLSKRLYVLEDIDCSELKDIVRDRSSESNDESKDSDQDSGNGNINDEETQNFLNLLKGPKTKVGDFLKEKKTVDTGWYLGSVRRRYGNGWPHVSNYNQLSRSIGRSSDQAWSNRCKIRIRKMHQPMSRPNV
jgi:hypothetical protein